MADYRALRDELAKPDLSALSDADAAAKLNADTVSSPKVGAAYANERGVLKLLGPTDGDAAMTSLESAAGSSSVLMRAVRILHDAGGPGLDFGDPATQGMVSQLQTQGVLTAPTAAALIAFGTSVVTRAQSIAGWALPVSAADVAHARSLS